MAYIDEEYYSDPEGGVTYTGDDDSGIDWGSVITGAIDSVVGGAVDLIEGPDPAGSSSGSPSTIPSAQTFDTTKILYWVGGFIIFGGLAVLIYFRIKKNKKE